MIVSNNGIELTSMAVILRWSQERQIEWHYIAQPPSLTPARSAKTTARVSITLDRSWGERRRERRQGEVLEEKLAVHQGAPYETAWVRLLQQRRLYSLSSSGCSSM